MPHHRLTYFDAGALAEGIRLIFAEAEIDYENVRVPLEEWEEKKKQLKPLWNQLPILEIDGEVIAQSPAIGRYLARKYGLAGKDEFEEALADSAVDAFVDFYKATRPFWAILIGFEKGDPEQKFVEAVVPARERLFTGMAKMLSDSGSGFLVGKSLTWADLLLSDFVATLHSLAPQLYDGHLEIRTFVERIRSRPRVKRYIEQRPKNVI